MTEITTSAPASWMPVIQTRGEAGWSKNGLRFATQDEARAWAIDLSLRWTLVDATGVEPSDEPVNYRYNCALHVLERVNDQGVQDPDQ